MRYLLCLLLLTCCTTCRPMRDLYHAPRATRQHYEHRQRVHERERTRRRGFLSAKRVF